jgi:hypothetical protein
MKRSLILVFFAIIVIALSLNFACKTTQNSEKSPAGVTTKFIKCLAKFELDDARKLGTEKTGRMIDMLDMLVELSKEKGADSVLKKKDVQVEILKTAIDGNHAVVTYRNDQGKEQTMDLIKEKGKWLVDMKKEMPNMDALPGKIRNEDQLKH